MKKTMIIAVVSLLILAFAATMVSAGPNQGRMCPFGNQAKLTDAQKEEMVPLFNEMKDLHDKMFQVQKQMIQKQVAFGNLTQAQADEHIARMEECKDNGPGMMGKGHRMGGRNGNGMGHGQGMGMGHGHGMMDDCPMNQLPPAANK